MPSKRETRNRKPAPPSADAPLDPTRFTPHFTWHGSALCAEQVPLARLASRFGTPAYVYSRAAIEVACLEYMHAFRSVPTTICYAVKANSNLSVLALLARLGCFFDIVSSGELFRLLRTGISTRRAVFSGVGKTRAEIREALQAGIFCFNIESEYELEFLLDEAGRIGRRAPAAIRVNPDVEAGGHRHIATGHHRHKFGIDWQTARRLYLAHQHERWLEWKGISAHVGSQVLDLAPVRKEAAQMAAHFADLRKHGVPLRHMDLGGGLGIRYTNENPPSLADYAQAITKSIRPLRCRLLLEPGRSIAGPAGILLTRVILTKSNRDKNFIVVDAAMNDFLRPALYAGVHPITPVLRGAPPARIMRADIVGPVCETGDSFLKDWPIEEVRPGDVLALWGAGAYGYVESSNYNSRPRPAEILVDGANARIIKQRESRNDLIRGEQRTAV